MLQRIAHATTKDFRGMGVVPPEPIQKLAAIGAYGKHQQNVHRDLTVKLMDPFVYSSLSPMLVWIKKSFLECKQISSLILLPHILFANMYKCARDEFVSRLLTPWKWFDTNTTYLGSILRTTTCFLNTKSPPTTKHW